jgi:hypothetical protein
MTSCGDSLSAATRPIATGGLHRGRLFHVHHKHFVRRLQGRLELREFPRLTFGAADSKHRYFPDERPIGIQDEENALLDAAPTHLQPLIIIALDASLRRGENAGHLNVERPADLPPELAPEDAKCLEDLKMKDGVGNGVRTRDFRSHSPALYR